jgi:hypothetical protein
MTDAKVDWNIQFEEAWRLLPADTFRALNRYGSEVVPLVKTIAQALYLSGRIDVREEFINKTLPSLRTELAHKNISSQGIARTE